MNTDQLYNTIQKIFVAFSGYFVAKGIGDHALWEIIGAAVTGLVTWYISHKWNASPVVASAISAVAQSVSSSGNQSSGPTSGHIRLAFMVFMSAVFSIAIVLIVGCASVAPGNDPIVVYAERAQTYAAGTFDTILGVDNSNRALWQSQAPAFHDFCEWLRQPQLAYLPDGTSTNVQRDIAMQLNLDKVKLDYKASKVTSNAVIEAISTLTSAEQQASAWLIVLTNQGPATIQPPNLMPTNPALSVPAVLLEQPDGTFTTPPPTTNLNNQ